MDRLFLGDMQNFTELDCGDYFIPVQEFSKFSQVLGEFELYLMQGWTIVQGCILGFLGLQEDLDERDWI